jgi:hypothetical protein
MRNFALNQYWLRGIFSSLIVSLTIFSDSVAANNHQLLAMANLHQSQLRNSNTREQKQPDFSGTGRPGQQTAGESRGACPQLNSCTNNN